LENLKMTDFGKVGEAQITNDSLLLLDGRGNKEQIGKRLKQIANEIESISLHLTTHSSESISSAELERERLKARFANLANGVAIIKVGGITEVHVNEKIDIIVDALNATKCALAEGNINLINLKL
jgi:chaperonin GroEL